VSAERLTDVRLAAGLRANLPGAPADLLDAIVQEAERTPQVRPLPPLFAGLVDVDPVTRRSARLLLAAVLLLAMLAAAIGAGVFLQQQPPVVLGETDVALDARDYTFGEFPIGVTVRGAPGWLGGGGPQVAGVTFDLGSDREALLTVWRVAFVYESPCPDGAPRTPQRGVDEIAAALERLPRFQILASGPATIGGQPARHVELLSPTDPGCDNFAVWQTPGGAASGCRCLGNISQRLRLWILEVDGIVLIVDATDSPPVAGQRGTPPEVRAQLDAIVASIRIAPRD
jgi:hypothetical protein